MQRLHRKPLDLRETRYTKVLSIFHTEPKGTLLDVGCGDGAFAAILSQLGWKVLALEAYKPNAKLTLQKGVQCILADASSSIPLRDETFQAIFAGEILEHLVDTDLFIKELWRLLKPQGVAVITTPNLASFENRLRLLSGKYPKWVDFSLLQGAGHVRSYTYEVLARQLAEHGFRVKTSEGNFVPLLPQDILDDRKFPVLGILGKAWPTLSQGLIVSAQKISPKALLLRPLP